MKLSERCRAGQHPLRTIYSIGSSYETEDVVRWCPDCGAVVVDKDVDSRVNPGYLRKMELPALAKEAKNEDV